MRHRLVKYGLLATAIIAAGAVTAVAIPKDTAATASTSGLCALLPDAVGLYEGNPVTHMGFQIGKVDTITPESAKAVRVEFSLDSSYTIPADSRSVIRSTSILADRSLELVGGNSAGATLHAGNCIPLAHGVTPKSISDSIGSSTELINGVSPAGSKNLADTISSLAKLTDGNGADVGVVLTRISALLDNPDAAISDLGEVISNTAELTALIEAHRPELKAIIQAMPETTPDITAGLLGTTDLIDGLPELVIAVDDIERRAGPEVQGLLDVVPPVLRLAAAHAADINDLLKSLPGLIGVATRASVSGQQLTVSARGPSVRVRTPDPAALCRIVKAAQASDCRIASNGQVDLGLIQLITSGGAQ